MNAKDVMRRQVAAVRAEDSLARTAAVLGMPTVGGLVLVYFLSIFAFANFEATLARLTKAAFDMGEILHHIAAGHHLALLVAGSDFPAWDRNPQTGSTIFDSAEMRVATLAVKTGPQAGSHIDLPLLTVPQ